MRAACIPLRCGRCTSLPTSHEPITCCSSGCAQTAAFRSTWSTAPTGGSNGRPGELAAKETCQPGTHVTVLLPQRGTGPLLGRLLHDRTADKIAGVVSRIPRSAAMIIPFDVTARVEVLH